jgi:hypothetical protein
MCRQTLSLAALLTLLVSSLQAGTLSVEAFDNATVQPGGPRSGSSGKAFLNIEGSSNDNFASYGVADFNFGTRPAITGINSATLKFTQANAGFTSDGMVLLSLDSTSPPVDIQPDTSPLTFDGVDPGTATDVSDGDLTLEAFGGGPFAFTEVADGTVDSYSLGLTPSLTSELISRLNSGSPIRVVIGTGDADVAATWAGYSNFDYAGPTLVLDVVPEPASLMLLVIGAGIGVTTGRRQRV